MTTWDAYVDAVIRIEAPGDVVWVQPAPLAHTAGPYPDPDGRTLYVLTAHNPGGQVLRPRRTPRPRHSWPPSSSDAG